MAKKMLEYFVKYEPDEKYRHILDEATVDSVRVDRSNKRIEIEVSFAEHVSLDDLRTIEEEIKKAHDINGVRIIPRFPSGAFSPEAVKEAVEEAYRSSCLAQGFLALDDNGPRFTIDGDTVTVFTAKKGYSDYLGNTETALSDIVRKMYSKSVKFVISDGDAEETSFEEFARARKTEEAALFESIENERRAYMESVEDATEEVEDAIDHKEYFPATSLYDKVNDPEALDENIIKVGNLVFDTSSPVKIIGEQFDLSCPTPIARMNVQIHDAVALGAVYDLEVKETRNKDKTVVSFWITDEEGSIKVSAALPND